LLQTLSIEAVVVVVVVMMMVVMIIEAPVNEWTIKVMMVVMVVEGVVVVMVMMAVKELGQLHASRSLRTHRVLRA
jgi:hypothetical protein